MRKYAAIIVALLLSVILAGSPTSYAAKTVSRGQNPTGWLADVRYNNDGSNESIIITAMDYEDYSIMELSNPRRIVVDIFNVAAPGKQQIIEAGGKVIRRVRYAQFDTFTGRVVLEINSSVEYGVEKTGRGLLLYIGKKPTDENNEPTCEETATTTTSSRIAASKTISINNEFKLQYISNEANEDVAILISDYSDYWVTRLTDPDRLVITLPNAQYSGDKKQMDINGNQVKAISCVQSGKSGTSIMLTLNAQSQYSIKESKGKLLFSVQQPTYKNIEYHNNGDRVYFLLKNTVLTEGDEFLKDLYKGIFDNANKKYTMVFPTCQAELGNGIMEINDQYLKSLEVKTNTEEGTTELVFTGKDINSYLAYTRGSSCFTSITVLKPATQTQKLVVIDAGHGGIDTGAIYKDLLEKNINLDIAKRLNILLKKNGVKTYMLREDDSYVANYEKAYIANSLNAKLYLSIHNNAIDDKNYRGTMTLYCPTNINSSFTGKTFANIIQPKMLSYLKTVNRNVRSRPDLIVLKATAMPAAIVEVAFMTNSYDRNNLQNSTFRQKAAQALCDSVVNSLSKMK